MPLPHCCPGGGTFFAVDVALGVAFLLVARCPRNLDPSFPERSPLSKPDPNRRGGPERGSKNEPEQWGWLVLAPFFHSALPSFDVVFSLPLA